MSNIEKIIFSSQPEDLEFPPPSLDHSHHVVYLTLKGHTRLAADHLLHQEMRGRLVETLQNVVRQLNFVFNVSLLNGFNEREILICGRAYDTLLNMALNFYGFERKIVGFSEKEVDEALEIIVRTLEDWERLEREELFNGKEALIARTVVKENLNEMERVMQKVYRPPGAMVAYIAKEIEKKIDEKNILKSFLEAAKESIRSNIYYKASELGICKFGNDYALGLRWLRHLGFVQVSTNPSLAAIAYDDDPSQWEGYKGENLCVDFKTILRLHPELMKNPGERGDELAAYATEVSIWRNLTVFRPIAIASGMLHGMISLQLNPLVADSYEKSMQYALKFYSDAEEFLKKYDAYLLWGYSNYLERGRPNIVFKVAGSSPAAIEITRKLESLGIGTNNTVTFTVSQEVELILAKIDGRAEAIRKGIPLTTVYETNMGGRLDDHIREVQAEKIILEGLKKSKDREESLRKLAEALNAWNEIKDLPTIEEKVVALSSRKYLNPINKEPLIKFLAENGIFSTKIEEVKRELDMLENDIEYCGILVTKRVYEIFFSSTNRPKWIKYIQARYGLTKEQAEMVIGRIDVLPASKRHPKETLLTFADKNMTHTEFPNHQMNVLNVSLSPDFNIEKFRESVNMDVDPKILERLTSKWGDIRDEFIRAYELTPSQLSILETVGILNPKRYGERGVPPEEWSIFGSTVKTMKEFSSSYELFKKRCIEFAKKFSSEIGIR
ncbi:MAG: transaldolase family protein [Nitrososphaerota archaeon]|nr:hypothetical protein [Candidatus Bathyarchaeota archaeon]MDW8048396.1 transaldolase family protein [Nitrososphaerota archaeon]